MKENLVYKNVHSEFSRRPAFKRRFVKINLESPQKVETLDSLQSEESQKFEKECTALVINSSFTMAKEITLAITLKMPNCSIMYAPGLEIAKWILKRRKIDLVVSSSMMPDGSFSSLIPVCEEMESPPDLVVVGDEDLAAVKHEIEFGNVYSSVRYFNNVSNIASVPRNEIVKKLGADIRNDINNPLQEIVSMVFVARTAKELSSTTVQALEAIDKAAKGIAHTVDGLEDRIRGIK
ncbi:MAG: hypothetical protein SGJ02_12435 [bacterium]|mgnify:CR=1 FL=1|nr:hypothetical protein [bacterium]